MKELMNYALFLLVSLFVSSAYGAGDGEDIHFSDTIKLKGKGYSVDASLVFPFMIKECGGYIYMMDMHGKKECIYILDKKSMKLVTSFGKRGEGNGYITQPKNMYCQSHDSVWVYDCGKCEVTRWQFSPKDNSVKRVESFRLEGRDDWGPFDFTSYSDTSFIFIDDMGKGRYAEYSINGNRVASFGNIPVSVEERRTDSLSAAHGWASYLAYSPSHRILVSATQLGDVLEIYNMKDSSSIVLYGKSSDPQYLPYPGGGAIPTGIKGYCSVYIGSRYIYALFSGQTFDEIIETNGEAPDGGKYLRVFDLKGNPVKLYHLDRVVQCFFVDEDNGKIWATDVNNQAEPIVRFKF